VAALAPSLPTHGGLSIRRLTLASIALVTATLLPVLVTDTADAATPTYVTIMFSRAQYEGVVSPNCTPVPNAVTIWQVAQDLASHGYAATEAVSTSLEAETGERCNANGDLTLGWSDLRTLQSQYGWTITVRGNGDDRTLSVAQQTADSCDLLPTFVSEGFNDAWSMYSYYGGPYSIAMQTNVVAPCFAFGRTYSIGSNPLPVPSPYLVKVDSINGGNCANTALPCSKFGFTYTYTQPSALAALVQSGGWNIIQGYKFVTGSNATGARTWDCTGADPASHWTSRPEFYCYNDWLSVIDSIPASAQVVSPAFMADLQGRGQGGPLASIRLTPAAATIVAGGTQRFQVEGFDANGQDIGDVTGQTGFAIDGGGSCSGPACGAAANGTYTVTATDGAFSDSAQLTVVDPPQVAALTPVSGAAGDTVTITGGGLDSVTAVSFNGAAAGFQVVSPGQITAVVPAAASDGPVSLTALGGVTVPAGTFAVQPRIDSFAPQTAAPGATVAITGSGFIGATGVTVAGAAAAYTIVSANRITATVPAGAGTGPLTVTTPDGTATSSGSFTAGAPNLAISGFAPASGIVGSKVTITGSGFTAATSVAFNGTAAAFTVNGPTSITATVPAAGSAGKIAVRAGSTTATSSTAFLLLPTISSISPTSAAVGAKVVITGTGFVHATHVGFNGFNASYKVVSPTEIDTTVPAAAKSGPIRVTTPGGSAKSVRFTVLASAPHR